MNEYNPQPTDLSQPAFPLSRELSHLTDKWWCFVLIGVILLLCGTFALAYPFAASVGITIVFGVTLLIGGAVLIAGSFWTGRWSAFSIQILIGIAYLVTGVMIAETPVESTGVLTMLIAAMFIVGGLFRAVVSLVERFPMWGWSLANGIITLLLGVIIVRHFPEAALWLIGTLVGIEILFNGWFWIMLGVEARRLNQAR